MDINTKIEKLEELKKEFFRVSEDVMTGSMYAEDLFACAVINRAISMVSGFVRLIKDENYLCAVPIIRMQLDNTLRFFAVSIVGDANDFFNFYVSGNKIEAYKDYRGNHMRDFYLKTCLEKKIKGIQELYSETSRFVHLSDIHFLAIAEHCIGKKYQFVLGNNVIHLQMM